MYVCQNLEILSGVEETRAGMVGTSIADSCREEGEEGCCGFMEDRKVFFNLFKAAFGE